MERIRSPYDRSMAKPIDEWPWWQRVPYHLGAGIVSVWALPASALVISLVLIVPVIVGVAALAWALTFAGYALDDAWTFMWTIAVPYALGTLLLFGPIFLLGRAIWRRVHRTPQG
jgi:hypothetical protein